MKQTCMTSRLRWNSFFERNELDRLLFLPAVYDFKASLAEIPAHLFGQTEREMQTALEREVDWIRADVLTVGYDIYNVEAEAVGCRLLRQDGHPMPLIETPWMDDPAEADRLPSVPSTLQGRMPLFVETAAWAVSRFGNDLPVRGAVSGPFSMAATVCRRENLLQAVLEEPESVQRLLDRCTAWILRYAESFVAVGAGVVVFDSFASPPLISPRLYRDLILPYHQRIFRRLKERGVMHRPLILGGNTASILPYLLESEANQFLLDFSIPPAKRKELLQANSQSLFRVNLPPRPIAEGSPEEIGRMVQETCRDLADCRNYILGTGILPYATPLENIAAIRNVLTGNPS